MAASQGCWARGLDGPWACGREDLSSGSSRAWLAGLDPCVAVQRSASQCILKLQLQMRCDAIPASRTPMGRSEMWTGLYADGGGGRWAWLYAPASTVQTTAAADAPPVQHAWHARRRRLHDLFVVRLGQLRCAACFSCSSLGGREGGRRRLAAHGCAVFHTNKLFSVEFEAVQYSSPHFATRWTLPSSPRPSEQRPVPPRRHVRRRCSVE